MSVRLGHIYVSLGRSSVVEGLGRVKEVKHPNTDLPYLE